MKLSQAFPSERRARIYVTVTASRGLSAEQAEKVEGFLAEFLPRLRQEPGVREIMHGASLEGHDLTTIVVWESSSDARRYRESPLISERVGIEQELGLTSTRDGFAVTQHLR